MQKNAIYLVVMFFLCSFYSVQVFAWADNAKKLFDNDEYEEVIDIAREHKKDRDRKLGLMLLTFSHLQLYELQETKSDKSYYTNYLEILEDNISFSHLDDLNFFIEQTDKPQVVKVAQKILKIAFKNIKDVKYTPKLVSFLRSENKKTRKLAMNTVRRLFKNKRKYINKGGTLRNGGIMAMQDEQMIRALLDLADESRARDSLVYIERPVLVYIADYEGGKIENVEEKILKAISKREKKFPKSTWYSATGKVKEVAIIFEKEQI